MAGIDSYAQLFKRLSLQEAPVHTATWRECTDAMELAAVLACPSLLVELARSCLKKSLAKASI